MAIFSYLPFITPRIISITNKTRINKKDTPAQDIIDRFMGETLVYDISFLWFKRAANGVLSLREENGEYVATLEAETKGFIGWLTAYRKYVFMAYLYTVDNKRGLRSRIFERYAIIKKNEEKVITYLDHDNRLMSWREYKSGVLVKIGSEPIPENIVYYDVLSAFYNFRNGFYGDIEKGREYVVTTIPQNGESEITIRMATDEEEEKERRDREKRKGESLIIVKVPKEIFESKTGEVKIWLSESLVPIEVTVKDYIGFGDVIGYLKDGL
ncbi:MAG: DUF3108 domain-containing protein [Nitrospinota bacterium]